MLMFESGIPSLTSESIIRKLRLIALTTLASQSTNQELTYSEIATALQIDEKEVEAWVIDGESDRPRYLTTLTAFSYPGQTDPRADISTSIPRSHLLRFISRNPRFRCRRMAATRNSFEYMAERGG